MVQAGPDNPLGSYAMRLAIPDYLIHGTNRPYGVGLRVSHGCIRLFPEDIEHLFGIVPINTAVEILYQPYKAALHDHYLHIEAHEIHKDMDFRKVNNMTSMVAAIINVEDKIIPNNDWSIVESIVRNHQGIVKNINRRNVDYVDYTWCIYSGLNQDMKIRMNQVLTSIIPRDFLITIRGSAMSEVLIGPFDNKEYAKQMAHEVNRLTGIPVWTGIILLDIS